MHKTSNLPIVCWQMSYTRPLISMENHRRAMEPELGWLAPCLSAAAGGTLTNPFLQHQQIEQPSAAVPSPSPSIALNRVRPPGVYAAPEQEATNFRWYPLPVEVDPKVENRFAVGLSTKPIIGSSSMYFRDKRHNAFAMGSPSSDVTTNGGLISFLQPIYITKITIYSHACRNIRSRLCFSYQISRELT